MLEQVGLYEVRERYAANLSGGMKRRLGIAQALIGDPRVVIFDEPTVGLDPKQILEVRNLIRNLGKNHTVILSTHILAEVQAICERVIIINKGKIIADERTEDITRTIEDGYSYEVKICGPAKEVQSALSKINGIKTAELTGARDGDAFVFRIESERGIDVRKPIFNLCAHVGWAIIGMMPVGTDLESVFIRLVDFSDGVVTEKKGKSRAH